MARLPDRVYVGRGRLSGRSAPSSDKTRSGSRGLHKTVAGTVTASWPTYWHPAGWPILEEWARRIAQWRRRADALVYFNNDWEGLAVDSARSLRRRFRNE